MLHAALDAVEEAQWQSTAMHLSTVDKFNALQVGLLAVLRAPTPRASQQRMAEAAACPQVSAFITAAQVKFLLLHDGKSDDTIKQFFKDVYEVYLRVMLNPFFNPGVRITSPAFTQRVRSIARTHFR